MIFDHTSKFILVVLALVGLFFEYLHKPSKYRRDKQLKLVFVEGELTRNFHDHLVWTSSVYGFAAVFAYVNEQYHMAFMCGMTCIGSTSYHLSRESAFFNFDNIFATSQIGIYTWTIYLSYLDKQTEFLMMGILGMPVAVFLLVYCGMPADIVVNDSKNCCVRVSTSLYSTVHTIWHFASGLGPMLAIWYFCNHPADSSLSNTASIMRSDYFLDSFGIFPVVPTLSLLGAVLVNILANISGIMPVD